MKLPAHIVKSQCTCTAGLCNCNVHFPDPRQVRLLESGKTVDQHKRQGNKLPLEAVGLATFCGLLVVLVLFVCLST